MNDLNNKPQLNKRKAIIVITSLLLLVCVVVGIAIYSKAQSNLKEESLTATTDVTESANSVDVKTTEKSDEPIAESSSSNEVEPTTTADTTNVDEESKATAMPSAKVEEKATTTTSTKEKTEATTPAKKATTPKAEVHKHSYTVSATTPATCTTQGSTTYTCACGDSYTETTAKAAHNFVATTETKTVRHSETYGNVTYIMASDGHIFGKAGEVNYDEVAAYCLDNGQSYGDITVSEVIAPAYDEQVTTTVYVCSVCGARQ